ncbi:hypothetical protein GFB49_04085 [Epibacterium sp. SM1979]|uniref:Uncharacterized protein n=1 Tax=Tritonibacter litoralis TaxID=2662264 RepID=A0A843Y9M9_9RHOB|nr:hypothetical protein [Tritonibacter litoralis]MQQ07626.1 hypothetical protein [Tritonibacter litoralis]
MVEISEIKDTSSLEAWLGGRFREYATVMAARSALRTLPLFWDWSLSERARKSGFMALPLLKCSFTAAVSSRYPKVSMKQIGVDVSEILNARAKGISSAAWDAGYAVDSAVRLQAGHAANAAYDAVTDVFVQKFFTGEPGSGFAEARSMADASIWGNVRSDCSDLKRGIDLLSSPLWRDENPLADLWADLRPKILSAENWQPGDWRFWVEWYEQMLDPITNPPNWELLKQVALLEPEVWDAGPKDVSEAIAEIENRFALLGETKAWQQRAEALEAEIAALKMRSHNQPPELVEDIEALEAPVLDLTQNLAVVAEELEKPEPEKHLLRRCGEVIRDAALAIIKYCGSIANDVIRAGAKTLGTGGAGLVLDSAFNDGRLVEYATKLINGVVGG